MGSIPCYASVMSWPKDSSQTSEEEPFLLTVLPFAGLGALLLLAVVCHYLPRAENQPGTENPSASVVERWERQERHDIPIDPARDYRLGAEDAAVTIVAFSDFQCPYCADAAEAVAQILKDHEGEVRLVFKNFPLDIACNERMEQQLHALACQVAFTARCAGRQREELFWEVHDALFDVRRMTIQDLNRVPMELDVAIDALNACVSAQAPLANVKEDIALGRDLGVRGTPTLFINGKKLADYRNAALEQVVEHVLESGAQ